MIHRRLSLLPASGPLSENAGSLRDRVPTCTPRVEVPCTTTLNLPSISSCACVMTFPARLPASESVSDWSASTRPHDVPLALAVLGAEPVWREPDVCRDTARGAGDAAERRELDERRARREPDHALAADGDVLAAAVVDEPVAVGAEVQPQDALRNGYRRIAVRGGHGAPGNEARPATTAAATAMPVHRRRRGTVRDMEPPSPAGSHRLARAPTFGVRQGAYPVSPGVPTPPSRGRRIASEDGRYRSSS